jgi:hypothetical protein
MNSLNHRPYKNKSGATDLTAYFALNNVERDEQQRKRRKKKRRTAVKTRTQEWDSILSWLHRNYMR